MPNLRAPARTRRRPSSARRADTAARIIFIDPRRTPTSAACEAEAGKDNVLHLAVKSGTDLALLNALFTEIAAKDWVDHGFIAAGPANSSIYGRRGRHPIPGRHPGAGSGFNEAVKRNHTTIEEAAKITGLSPDDIRKAAAWIAEPKQGGARRRTMFAYEKGLIWGNDNYRTNQALVNVALATGNLGRPGGGCVRLGGHQEGYVRPDYPGGRPAPYVDQLLISGQGGVHHVWGCDHFKTTLNASEFKRIYKRRTDMVKEAIELGRGRRPGGPGRGNHAGDPGGWVVRRGYRHRANADRQLRARDVAGGDGRRGAPDQHERRASHAAHRALHGPARAARCQTA